MFLAVVHTIALLQYMEILEFGGPMLNIFSIEIYGHVWECIWFLVYLSFFLSLVIKILRKKKKFYLDSLDAKHFRKIMFLNSWF